MKTTLTILISGLLLCSCAHRQAASAHRAIDSIQAGKDVVWNNGLVLHVAKRDGDSVEGIRIVSKTSDGREWTTTADTGTLLPGSVENPADAHSVRLTLQHVQRHSATTSASLDAAMFVLSK